MKKLFPKDARQIAPPENFFFQYAEGLDIIPANKVAIVEKAIVHIELQDKALFYPLIGEILNMLGFHCRVSPNGDNSNRADAFLIDPQYSIPIEIKSPTETVFINNKSVRQAVENKVVLLSRKHYPTTHETTSLAIGFTYPADRSGVYDLIDDVFNTYHFNIGIISLKDLLDNLWEFLVNGHVFDKERIKFLKGQLQ